MGNWPIDVHPDQNRLRQPKSNMNNDSTNGLYNANTPAASINTYTQVNV